MLSLIFVSLLANAGEIKLTENKGLSLRRLFAVCESPDAKCSGGKCKINLTQLKCERVPGGTKGNCTFKCNGNEHMLTGDQALDVFKNIEGQKKMIQATESTESFKDASITCDPVKSETSAVCKIKHSKIK